jgi:hypothetical protein
MADRMAAFQTLSIRLPDAKNEAVSWACAAFAMHGGFSRRSSGRTPSASLSHEFGALRSGAGGAMPEIQMRLGIVQVVLWFRPRHWAADRFEYLINFVDKSVIETMLAGVPVLRTVLVKR